MKKINPHGYFDFGVKLATLNEIKEGVTLATLLVRNIRGVQSELYQLIHRDEFPFEKARKAAKPLLKELEKFFPEAYEELEKVNFDKSITKEEAEKIARLAFVFEIQFFNDLQSSPHFYVEPKGIYSFERLIEEPLSMFPEFIVNELSDKAKTDITEFAFCFAFERWTASGFHIMRATEDVLRQYVRAYNGGKLPSKNDWGEYVKVLGQNKASRKITRAIEILRERRNPLMHPQDDFTQAEADMLFGLCKSLIPVMLSDAEKKKATTDQNKDLLALIP